MVRFVSQKKPGGHPARKDPEVEKLFRTMRGAVESVRDIGPRLTPENNLRLRAAALGLMHAYSEISGLPAPDEHMKGNTP